MKDPVRDVLAAITEAMITPSVARSGDLDGYITSVKQGVVQHLARHSDAAKEILARHFGKSDRWVYRMLSDYRAALKDQSPENQGRQIVYDLLLFIQSHYPETLTADDCHRALRQKGWRLERHELDGLLKLYADTNILIRHDGEGSNRSEVRYGAPGVTNRPLPDSTAYRERVDMVRSRMRPLGGMLVSFVRGESGSMLRMDTAKAYRHHYEAAAKDIRRYAIQRVQQAVLDSVDEEPDEKHQDIVEFSVLTIIGPNG